MPVYGGIVLCGGRSSRIGRPKAWLPFGGETLLQRVVRVVASAVSPVVVVGAPCPIMPPLPADVNVISDPAKGFGPLQGLAAGLQALRGQVDAVYVSSCDVPFLHAKFIRRMIALLEDSTICVPFVHGFHHPLSAVYRTEVLPTVEKFLASGQLRPSLLFQTLPTRVVTAEDLKDADPQLLSLFNVNSLADYERALGVRSAEIDDRDHGG